MISIIIIKKKEYGNIFLVSLDSFYLEMKFLGISKRIEIVDYLILFFLDSYYFGKNLSRDSRDAENDDMHI